jgi:hypothetical protein
MQQAEFPRHLFADISAHGFGHLSQAAPVLNALAERLPALRLTVRSGLSAEKLRARLRPAFTHLPASSDFGYVMRDAVRVDLPATARAYRAQHKNWAQRVADEAALLSKLQAQLVFSDVAYLPLAGAAQAGIPAVALCSLNWADLFAHYFGAEDWAPPIHQQMLAAYNSAAFFLRATPGMPMPDLQRLRPIGPIAALGNDIRQALRQRLGCPPNERLLLIAFGGFDKRLPIERWPPIENVRWLVPAAWPLKHAAVSATEPLGYPFTDLLRAVDAVITKPGYGTFAEAACNGTRVLYLRRDDWPEQDYLIDWLKKNGSCYEVGAADLMSGHLQEPLSRLFEQARPAPPLPGGIDEAAEVLLSRFRANRAV